MPKTLAGRGRCLYISVLHIFKHSLSHKTSLKPSWHRGLHLHDDSSDTFPGIMTVTRPLRWFLISIYIICTCFKPLTLLLPHRFLRFLYLCDVITPSMMSLVDVNTSITSLMTWFASPRRHRWRHFLYYWRYVHFDDVICLIPRL